MGKGPSTEGLPSAATVGSKDAPIPIEVNTVVPGLTTKWLLVTKGDWLALDCQLLGGHI